MKIINVNILRLTPLIALEDEGVTVNDSPQNGAAGNVTFLHGEAWVLRKGVKVPLLIGDLVFEGDTVATGSGSAIKTTLMDRSIVTIGPNSKTKFDKGYFESSPSNILTLLRGYLRGEVEQQSEDTDEPRLKIDTSNHSSGVRGTDFTAEYTESDGTATTTLVVDSGVVEMTDNARNDTILVEGGESAAVTSPIVPPPDSDGDRLADALEELFANRNAGVFESGNPVQLQKTSEGLELSFSVPSTSAPSWQITYTDDLTVDLWASAPPPNT